MAAAALEYANRAAVGSADGADLFVVELDRERVLGDVHREHAAGVDASERDVLAADGSAASTWWPASDTMPRLETLRSTSIAPLSPA